MDGSVSVPVRCLDVVGGADGCEYLPRAAVCEW